MEKALFSDLTPEQMSIKNGELMNNYMKLYDIVATTITNINNVRKTYENTRVLDYITTKLIELNDMVNTIITVTYHTKTFAENLSVYKQCLLMLKQIETMISQLSAKINNSKKD